MIDAPAAAGAASIQIGVQHVTGRACYTGRRRHRAARQSTKETNLATRGTTLAVGTNAEVLMKVPRVPRIEWGERRHWSTL
jgi:hypothetical protein